MCLFSSKLPRDPQTAKAPMKCQGTHELSKKAFDYNVCDLFEINNNKLKLNFVFVHQNCQGHPMKKTGHTHTHTHTKIAGAYFRRTFNIPYLW